MFPADPRILRLGELVAGWSLRLREGETVRIDVPVAAAPLGLALARAALRRGARPVVAASLPALEELLLREGSDEQLDFASPIAAAELDAVDAAVTVWADANTRARSRLDPAREQRRAVALGALSNRLRDRMARGEARWCGVLYPTHGHAQEAGMPLDEYADMVLAACHVDDATADPAAHWERVSAAHHARADALGRVRELRIRAEGTDLALRVDGRTWIAADGRQNMPDGEVFTSPLETSASGEVAFSFPVAFGGHELDGVRLRLAEGRVVHAEARTGGPHLRALLATDEGASLLGEVAFGLNREIVRATRHVGLDEKIGGTMHLAVGRGFPLAGGANRSAVHLDLVIDTRAGAEVLADGEVVFRDGRFVDEGAA